MRAPRVPRPRPRARRAATRAPAPTRGSTALRARGGASLDSPQGRARALGHEGEGGAGEGGRTLGREFREPHRVEVRLQRSARGAVDQREPRERPEDGGNLRGVKDAGPPGNFDEAGPSGPSARQRPHLAGAAERGWTWRASNSRGACCSRATVAS